MSLAKAEHPGCESGLLRLPSEIRVDIWKLLLSQEGIHVGAGKRQLCLHPAHQYCGLNPRAHRYSWSSYLCTSAWTPRQLHDWFRSDAHFIPGHDDASWESNLGPYMHGWNRCDERFQHGYCGFVGSKCMHGWDEPSMSFRHNARSLLQLCRATSAEVAYVLYNTNSFIFRDEVDLARWMGERTPSQKSSLSALQIVVDYRPISMTFTRINPLWEEIFSPARVAELSCLTRLHIFMREEDYFTNTDAERSQYADRLSRYGNVADQIHQKFGIDELLGCFKQLRSCPLKEITSVVGCCWVFGVDEPPLLTQRQRLQLADDLVSTIQCSTER